MAGENIPRATLDQLPKVAQKVELICRRCSRQASYDVGMIFYDEDPEAPSSGLHFAFSKYFRCLNCDYAGPWDIAHPVKLQEMALRSMGGKGPEGIVRGRFGLFDGTFTQTPAMAEEHLLSLAEDEPGNAFICSRVGNLYRACDMESKAAEWYERAVSLDPGELESRFHLFGAAVDAKDVPGALKHVRPLVRFVLQGRQAERPELTRAIATAVVENVLCAPVTFVNYFLHPREHVSELPEDIFLRTLLVQTGDEEEIIQDAVDRMLRGQPAPAIPADATLEIIETGAFEEPAPELVPSLLKIVESGHLNPTNLTLAALTGDEHRIHIDNRQTVAVSDGAGVGLWSVPSLSELFRGSRPTPPDIAYYPPEYCPHFFYVETNVLALCDLKGDRPDQELEEAYSMLRRRPDGRSLGDTHDFLWQVAALLLGRFPLSEAEFRAIFGQLEASVRKWALRPISRNYVAYLRKTLDSDG